LRLDIAPLEQDLFLIFSSIYMANKLVSVASVVLLILEEYLHLGVLYSTIFAPFRSESPICSVFFSFLYAFLWYNGVPVPYFKSSVNATVAHNMQKNVSFLSQYPDQYLADLGDTVY
jgi:hypothetical protein